MIRKNTHTGKRDISPGRIRNTSKPVQQQPSPDNTTRYQSPPQPVLRPN